MRRLEPRVYAGVAGETVTVDTEVEGSGAVTVRVDNVGVSDDTTFELKEHSGDETKMSIRLVGAVGDSCVVQIGEVDGSVDPDLLLCQTIDASPVHVYRFIVTPASAIATMERVARRTLDSAFTTVHARRAERTTSVTSVKSAKSAKSAKAAKNAKAAKSAKSAKSTRSAKAAKAATTRRPKPRRRPR